MNVLTICAASRYAEQIPAIALRLNLAGNLVYAPHYLGRQPTDTEHATLIAVHHAAIHRSDGIHVVGAHIGKHVAAEIDLAMQLGRFVNYEPLAVTA